VVISAGVSRAYLIDQALAAALGARLPINEPTANMIVDIGAGTTEIAIISMGGKVTSKSLKIAGEKLNDDIIRFIRDEFRLIIGEPTAEELKIQIGSAMPLTDKLEMVIQGRDNSNGLPKEVTVRDIHVRTAISKSLRTIVENIRSVIESAPPELSGDILKNGVFICGGTSMLRLFSEMISRELSVAVHLVDDPRTCVVRGTGVAIERFEEFKEVLTYPYAPRDIKV
jgi:rod shape-determining protein MreB